MHEKTNNLGFRPGRNKPVCIVSENSERLEISGLSRGGIVLSV